MGDARSLDYSSYHDQLQGTFTIAMAVGLDNLKVSCCAGFRVQGLLGGSGGLSKVGQEPLEPI